ncbi:MAG: hypothetical protein O8C67_08405 [Candidatus Methanoperedens sp.]|nr:hypothetical protein [Candidatus Methanoperedens sp.]
MKKFTDVKGHSNFTLGLYILLVALLMVALSIFGDYLVSIFTNKQPDYTIQAQITSTILAFSTIILVIITANYAKSTKEMLDEQIKMRKIGSIEKRLENIYSPINIAFNKFRLNCESLPEDRIPSLYNNAFKDLNDVIMDIASKYGHLFNQETINYYDHEVLPAWLQYSRNPTDIASYKLLNSRIIMFNDFNGRKLYSEKKLLFDLQQLGENMTFDEKLIESKEIRKIFLKAVKEDDKSFLDKFKEKKNLIYIQKLAEIEISKENSDIGTRFTLMFAGLSIFLVYASDILKPPPYLLKVYFI